MVAAAFVLYVTLRIYLGELLQFLSAPNPRVASLALGISSRGFVFVALLLCDSRSSRSAIWRWEGSIRTRGYPQGNTPGVAYLRGLFAVPASS